MKGLNGFYIVRKDGVLLFSHESLVQGSGDWNLALLSSVICALQGIARELGKESTKVIEIGDKKLYTSIDIEFGLIFIVRADSKTKAKKIGEILKDFKDKFLKKYTNLIITETQNEKELELGVFNEFRDDLLLIIPSKSAAQTFIERI